MAKKSQIDKFREKAREIGADLDESAFDEALRKVAKTTRNRDEGCDDAPDHVDHNEKK
jgi:hypothetical protein